jgi:hypothetical protein
MTTFLLLILLLLLTLVLKLLTELINLTVKAKEEQAKS